MGKIILTERQYRNLNQILIGKEVENNKGRLNEMTETEKLDAERIGKKINKIYERCNSNTVDGNSCFGDLFAQLKLLKTKDQFTEAAKFATYWYANNWQSSIGNFFKKLMYIIFLKKGDLMIKYANIIAGYFKVAGGTLTFSKGYDKNGENLNIKPMSFNLSWKPVTPAAATPAATNLNWGGSGTDPDRYWNGEKGLFEKLKPYGVKYGANGKTVTDPKLSTFMYWGKNYIMKDYSAGGGYNIVLDGLNYKFAAYGGKYAGQPLESITLTPKINGENQYLVTLLGKKTETKKDKKVYDKPVVGGGGTGTGGTGGGTGTGGGGAPFSGQYADLV
jgi:hypothetical protein